MLTLEKLQAILGKKTDEDLKKNIQKKWGKPLQEKYSDKRAASFAWKCR